MGVHAKKRFLKQVLRIARAPDHPADVVEQWYLVSLDQNLEHIRIPFQDEGYQLLVAPLGHTMSATLGIRHRRVQGSYPECTLPPGLAEHPLP